MSENLHDIDKLFQDGLGPMEEMPSGKVWEQLDHALDKKHLAQTRRRYSRLKWYAAALLVLLIGTLVFQLSRKAKPETPGMVTAPASERQEQTGGTGNKPNEQQPPLVVAPAGAHKDSETAVKDPQSNVDEKVPVEADQSDELSGQGASTSSSPENKEKATVGAEADNEKKSTSRKIDAGSRDVAANAAAEVPTSAKPQRAKLQGEASGSVVIGTAKANERRRTKKMGNGHLNDDTTADLSTAGADQLVNSAREDRTLPVRIKKPKVQNGINPANDLSPHTSTAAPDKNAMTAKTSPRMPEGRYLTALPQTSSLKAIVAAPAGASPGIAYVPPVMTKAKASLHFSVMPYLAAQFNTTRVEKDDQHAGGSGPQRPPEPERIRASESNSSSSVIGIMGELALGKNWSVQTGIGYIARSITIQPKKIFAEKDNEGKVKYRFDCSGGYTYIDPKAGASVAVGDSTVTTASVTRLGYISVPLMLNYSLGASKRFSIIPGAGVVGNFRVTQKIETGLDGVGSSKENFTSIQGLRGTYFSVMAGVALQYNLSRRLSINVIPAGNWAISSINQNAVVKSYPNAFSIQGGLKIQL